MTELERRVARAMWESEGWRHYETDEPDAKPVFHKWDDLSEGDKEYEVKRARAALKAHAEYLEEQGLEIVCTGRPHSRKPTIAELEKILEGPAGRVRITPAGEVVVEPAKKEDQNHD